MILLDFNGVVISSILYVHRQNVQMTEDSIRRVILSTIIYYKKKFAQEYGELIICIDSREYWRTSIFPYYKGCRKQQKEESAYDWDLIYKTFDKVKVELAMYFPYKMVECNGAEADDVIGIIVKSLASNLFLDSVKTPVLIVSSDKDFAQLLKYTGVKQFSPSLKTFVGKPPKSVLFEHICRGDRGDGVPNILSEDNVFVIPGLRQNRLTSKRIDQLIAAEDFLAEMTDMERRNYYRNKKMIDFEEIPQDITNKVLDKYNTAKAGSKNKILSYFVKFKLGEFMDELKYI